MDDGLVSSKAERSHVAPENAIIAFDLHDVLFRRDVKASILAAPSVAYQYLWHPTFVWRMKGSRSFEDAYNSQHQDYSDDLQGIKKSSIDFANCQTPMDGMQELLEELVAAGSVIYLFSNIGGVLLDDLRAKFPQIFNNFHGFHTPTQENGYVKKPSPDAYRAFLDQFNAERDKTIIFFDDKKVNIDTALQNGFLGTQFTSSKQARAYLVTLGVLQAPQDQAP